MVPLVNLVHLVLMVRQGSIARSYVPVKRDTCTVPCNLQGVWKLPLNTKATKR